MSEEARTAIVTAWNNGSNAASGAGYGLKIAAVDRDRLFHRNWQIAILELEGAATPVTVNVAKPSFWGPKCRELIQQGIGLWLIANGWAPWQKDQPPRFKLTALGGNHFSVSRCLP